jgi:hypothetical protein
MNRVELLASKYRSFVEVPWKKNAAGAERIWFAVYDEADERRLRARLAEFELATKEAHHGWHQCDVTDMFAVWLASHEYRESFFVCPTDMSLVFSEFLEYARDQVLSIASKAQDDDVVAIYGVSALFGFTRVSELLEPLKAAICGRLLVFFPGRYENNVYRLLNARDGWSYLATPITSHDGAKL